MNIWIYSYYLLIVLKYSLDFTPKMLRFNGNMGL